MKYPLIVLQQDLFVWRKMLSRLNFASQMNELVPVMTFADKVSRRLMTCLLTSNVHSLRTIYRLLWPFLYTEPMCSETDSLEFQWKQKVVDDLDFRWYACSLHTILVWRTERTHRWAREISVTLWQWQTSDRKDLVRPQAVVQWEGKYFKYTD